MPEDPTESRSTLSEAILIESGDSGGTVTVLELNDGQTFMLTDFVVWYSGAATVSNINTEMQDTDSADAVGDTNEDDAEMIEELDPGGRVERNDLTGKEFENDVVAIVDRDAVGVDDDTYVEVSGILVT